MTEAKQISIDGELEHLFASARDSLTDDMVTRLSANLSQALCLLDQFNRSGIDRALPAIARMVENGSLDRMVGIAHFVGAVEDSLSDDIVNRLSLVATELAALVDKLSRNEGFLRLIDLLSNEETQETLIGLIGALSTARSETATAAPSKGGLGGALKLLSDPATQDAMRFMASLSRQLNKGDS